MGNLICKSVKQIPDHTKGLQKISPDLETTFEGLKHIDDHAPQMTTEDDVMLDRYVKVFYNETFCLKQKIEAHTTQRYCVVQTSKSTENSTENLTEYLARPAKNEIVSDEMGSLISKSAKQTPEHIKGLQKISPDLETTFEGLTHIDDHALQTTKSTENNIENVAAYLARPAENEIISDEIGSNNSKSVKQTKEHITGLQKISPDLETTFESLKHIDDYALQTPKSAEDSIENLAEYLARPAKNEIEIIRAFYVWICNNISYNTEAYFSEMSAATTPDDVLKTKSCVCEGYAGIFLALCVAKDIKCKKISGFSKGYSHKLGTVLSYTTKTNHAWNVVFVGGKWRFVETTWGAGSMGENKQFVRKFSNFYFFTKPEHFIVDHFPYFDNDVEESKIWQLMKRPIPLETFSKSCKPTYFSRTLGIQFPNHQFEVVDINREGIITMESKQNILQDVSIKLFDSSGTFCNDAVIIKINDVRYTIIIKPKQVGRYFLQIFGTNDNISNSVFELIKYLIECTSTEDNVQPFPEHGGFYGTVVDIQQRGICISRPESAFKECKNGEFELQMKTTKAVSLSAKVFHKDEVGSKDFVLVEQSDHAFSVKVRFTDTGYYKLTIYSPLEGIDGLSEAMNILVKNKIATKMPIAFPEVYSIATEYKCHLIEPLVRYIPSNSNVRFVMSSPVITELIIDNEVYQKEAGDDWDINMKTRDAGPWQIGANTDPNNSRYPIIYQFEVMSM